MKRFRIIALAATMTSIVLVSAAPLEAQRRPRPRPQMSEEGDETASFAPAGAQPTVRDVQAIAARLDSAQPDEVREAVAMLSVIDHPSVIPHLAAMLRSGRSDEVTDDALIALRGLAHPSAVEVLVELTRHRRVRARRLAYQALAAIDDPRVPALLERGLRDSDRNVRATAARALGEIGARGSVDTLFLAFDRGVVEAAIAIGKLGDRASVARFGELLGRTPLSVMLSGYVEYLNRADIPDEVKTEIIGRLSEISGPQVRSFLQRYLDTLPSGGPAAARSGRIRTVVIDALRRIPGAASQARDLPSGNEPSPRSEGGAQ